MAKVFYCDTTQFCFRCKNKVMEDIMLHEYAIKNLKNVKHVEAFIAILNASIQKIIQNSMTNAHTLKNWLPLKYFSVTEVYCLLG